MRIHGEWISKNAKNLYINLYIYIKKSDGCFLTNTGGRVATPPLAVAKGHLWTAQDRPLLALVAVDGTADQTAGAAPRQLPPSRLVAASLWTTEKHEEHVKTPNPKGRLFLKIDL